MERSWCSFRFNKRPSICQDGQIFYPCGHEVLLGVNSEELKLHKDKNSIQDVHVAIQKLHQQEVDKESEPTQTSPKIWAGSRRPKNPGYGLHH